MYYQKKRSLKYSVTWSIIGIVIAVLYITIASYNSIKHVIAVDEQISKNYEILNSIKDLKEQKERQNTLLLQLMMVKNEDHIKTIERELQKVDESITVSIDDIQVLLQNSPYDLNTFEEMRPALDSSKVFKLAMVSKIKSGIQTQEFDTIVSSQARSYLLLNKKISKLEDDVAKNIKDRFFDSNSTLENSNTMHFILNFSVILALLYLLYRFLVMIKLISDEIKSGIYVIGNSASDILSTVTDISTGAAETATAVSETTTTVEEVRQTSILSSQKARSLMNTSQNAANAVESGKDSVYKVILAMQKIDQQMGLISETVVKLSDQNRAIGDITSTVSEMADQSNLLAVNAAIEAAKAGEHGRGFTVVAEEIRVLADQSKRATEQVKDILNEINKSVIQAVDVTNEGIKAVEESRSYVSRSGEAIDLLSQNIEQAAQAAIQIASSSQQQMAGMEQIVPAMENIKNASEQNLNGIKHAQSAAHDMDLLGRNLRGVIEKYRL